MADSTLPTTRRALLATAAALRAQADAIEALANVTSDVAGEEVPVTLEVAAKRTDQSAWTYRGWVRTGRLPATRGSRGAILVRMSDVRAALAAEPVVPRRRAAETGTTAVDPFEALLASGELREGGRR